jgi:hypothetical protein
VSSKYVWCNAKAYKSPLRGRDRVEGRKIDRLYLPGWSFVYLSAGLEKRMRPRFREVAEFTTALVTNTAKELSRGEGAAERDCPAKRRSSGFPAGTRGGFRLKSSPAILSRQARSH